MPSPTSTSSRSILATRCRRQKQRGEPGAGLPGCNNLKYNKTRAIDPLTRESVPLFHPRKHDWHEHFVWSDDYTVIVGLTPIGRATIAELDLNRAGVVNQRKLLLLIRKHPPGKYQPA